MTILLHAFRSIREQTQAGDNDGSVRNEHKYVGKRILFQREVVIAQGSPDKGESASSFHLSAQCRVPKQDLGLLQ